MAYLEVVDDYDDDDKYITKNNVKVKVRQNPCA